MSIAVTPVKLPIAAPQLSIRGIEFRSIDPWRPPADLPSGLSRATPRRQAEFLAGRIAADHACRPLGIDPGRLPVGSERRPVWPPGVIGSISHSDNLAVAAVGVRSRCAGVGIDVEKVNGNRRTDFLVPAIVSEDEIAMLRDRFGSGLAALLLFSAREAIYKAISPFLSGRLSYREFLLTGCDSGRLLFARRSRKTAHRHLPRDMSVLFARTEDYVATLYVLPAVGTDTAPASPANDMASWT